MLCAPCRSMRVTEAAPLGRRLEVDWAGCTGSGTPSHRIARHSLRRKPCIYQIAKATAWKRPERVLGRRCITQLRPKIIHDRLCSIGVSVHVLTDFEFGFGTTGYQCTSPRTGEADEGAHGDDSMAKLLVPEERRLLSGRDRVLYTDGVISCRRS